MSCSSRPTHKFKVPEGHTEQEILEAIGKAVKILAPSFVFGYFDLDDIKQQATLFGIEVVRSWDTARPLENFVYTHIRNRLINFRRDKLRRNDPPCRACHEGRPCSEGSLCERYTSWLKRNNAKANIMRPVGLDRVSDEKEPRTRNESTVTQDAELAETLEKIDRELPVELRAAYLQMRDGVAVPKAKREEVIRAVRHIMSGDPEWDDNEDA